ASTAEVFFGHGPSSKVSTTSPSRRKSWLLKCSKPKPGPPVVSISTTRETPSASGLPGHEEPARAGAGDAGSAAAAGTCGAADVGATATVEELRTPTVGLLGATPEVKAGFAADSLAGGAPCSAIVVTTARAEPSVDAVCTGDVEPSGTEALCESMVANTPTQTTIVRAATLATSLMANLCFAARFHPALSTLYTAGSKIEFKQ